MLGDALDLDELTAELDEGVLTVKVPVAENSKQRKIHVEGSTSKREAIESSSTYDTSGDSASG